MTTFRDAWHRYRETLATRSPVGAALLQPPATAARVDEAERALGFALGPDVRALYMAHDGTDPRGSFDDDTPVPFAVCLFIPLVGDVDSAVSEWARWAEMIDAGVLPADTRTLLPFAKDFGGNSLLVSCGPRSEVWRYDHENGVELLRIAGDLAEFLGKERGYLERGLTLNDLINEGDDYRYRSD